VPASSPTALQMNYADDQSFTGQVTLSGGSHPDLTLASTVLTFYVGTSASPVITKTIGSGVVVDAAGNFTVTISHADASSLKAGSYLYAVVYTPPAGTPTETVAYGTFTVVPTARV